MPPAPGVPGPPNPFYGRTAPGASLPALLTESPTALSLFKALRRCWVRALTVGLLVAAVAGTATWLWFPPSKVTARTVLKIDPNSKFLFTVGSTPNPVEFQRTQMALLKSRPVLSSALKQPGVSELVTVQAQPDPVVWLEKEVNVDFLAAQNVMRITMSGHNRGDLVTLVTAVRESYKKNILDRDRDNRQAYLKKLTELRQEQRDKLNAKRKELGPLVQNAGGDDPAVRSLGLIFMEQQLGSLQKDLISTQGDKMRCNTKLELRRAEDKALAEAKVPQEYVDDLLAKEPSVQKHTDDVARLKSLIEQHKLKSVLPEAKDETLKTYLRNKQAAETALAESRKRLTPDVTERARVARSAEVAKNIRQLEIEMAMYLENEKQLSDQVAAFQSKIQDLRKNGARLDVDRDDLIHLEWLNRIISEQETQLRIEIQNTSDSAEMIEDTAILRAGDDNRLILMTVATSVCTLIVVIGLFALWEFRLRRVGAADDVSQGLGLNLMGTLPDASARAYGARSNGGDIGHSLLAEAVDATRTILLRSARTDGLRVVMVTSAHSGEGKTSLSTHLAASLAQVGYRTLFIDGDLRNPIAHRVFELESEPGFCELLRGESEMADLIRPTPVDLLSMIPAGRWDGDASRALGREGFLAELLQSLRSEFDFIIIDSSPVLPVVDPLLIGQQADGTIISVLRDVSRMPSVYAAHQRLLSGGVKVLGAVVNGVRGEAYGATYYYRQRAGA